MRQGDASDPAGPRGGDERAALLAVLRVVDLTSLEPTDGPEVAERLSARAVRPDPARDDLPHLAAVCLLPAIVPLVRRLLAGTTVRVATVAGAFPDGRATPAAKAAEAAAAVEAGAEEVDLACDWRAVAAGDPGAVEGEVAAVRSAIGRTPLKAILETGALGEPGLVRAAAEAALAGGADWLKTSTGKVEVGATDDALRELLDCAAGHEARTGRPVGVKASGGIRTAAHARRLLEIASELRGAGSVGPDRFRLGASSLVDAVVARLGELDGAPSREVG
ncbi:MAG: deoxyribose-phosphate aldolase [Thermoleophilia bacterium]